jgi:hypothetical protein
MLTADAQPLASRTETPETGGIASSRPTTIFDVPGTDALAVNGTPAGLVTADTDFDSGAVDSPASEPEPRDRRSGPGLAGRGHGQ